MLYMLIAKPNTLMNELKYFFKRHILYFYNVIVEKNRFRALRVNVFHEFYLTLSPMGGGGALYAPPGPPLFFCPLLKISLGSSKPRLKILYLQNFFLLRMP